MVAENLEVPMEVLAAVLRTRGWRLEKIEPPGGAR